MLKRDPLDPAAHERFQRVWAPADPLDPTAEDLPPVPAPMSRQPPAGSAIAALNPGRRAVKALAVVGLVVVAIAAFVAWRSQPRAEVVSATSPPAAAVVESSASVATSSVSTSPAPSSAMLVVAVTGRVRHPGLVDLPPGSRVADAIAAAGGVLPKTDLSFVNLARKVADGELIVIGLPSSPGITADPTGGSAAGAPGGTPDGPVDLNTASLEQLETLSGIGPALAQRILDYRTQHGGFRSVDELQDVSGIGPTKFAAIKSQVTV
ncbi:MAG TPA: helix-hairpin-helix domain-containing protein [Micromonosporaceae bacterium]